jgi:hypothetical protein
MPEHAPRRAAPRFVLTVATSMLAVLLATAPSLAADPRPLGGPSGGSPRAPVERTRTVDLSRDGAAVTQYTSYWCVPASTQTMLNLIKGTSDRSYATQGRLYKELRAANKYRYATRGNDVRGWARVLTAHLPAGMGYADVSFSARADAYKAIVASMDRTLRPVGIVVDAGTHAWTVVGFRVHETVGVPGSQTILGFYVVGPLGSPRDPWPKAYYTVDQLSTRYTRYHEWQMSVIWEGKYVIVAPQEALGATSVGR